MLTENISVVWWGFHLQTIVSAVVHSFGDPASKGAHMAWPVGAATRLSLTSQKAERP